MPGIQREFLDNGDDDSHSVIARQNTGDDYALVIGVNDYPHLRRLRGAIADAQSFKAWLLDASGGGLQHENVHTILSTSNPLAPLGHEINDALEDILLRAQRSGGRRFYFYFSGHGAVGDRANDLALCLAHWSNIRRRAALSSEAWLDVIVRSGVFDEVAFFLDCCRVWATRAIGLPPQLDFAKPAQRERGTRVFLAYATEFQRPAVEVEEASGDGLLESRGIFTQALLAGLQGNAASSEATLSAAALKTYVERATETRAHALGFCQRAEVVNGFQAESQFGVSQSKDETRQIESPAPSDSLHAVIEQAQAQSIDWGATYERFRQQTQLQIRYKLIGDSRTSSRLLLVMLARETLLSNRSSSASAAWLICGAQKTIKLATDTLQRTLPEQGYVFSVDLNPGAYALRYNGRSSREMAIHLYSHWTTVVYVDDPVDPAFEHAKITIVPYTLDEVLPTWEAIRNAFLGLTDLNSNTTNEALNLVSTEPDMPRNPMLGMLRAYRIARAKVPSEIAADFIESMANELEATLGPCPDVVALRLRAALRRGAKLPRLPCTDPPMLREGLLAFIDASHQMPELIPHGSLLEYACVERLVDSSISSWPFHPGRADADDWLTAYIEDETSKRSGDLSALDPPTIARELGVPTLAVLTRLDATRERTTKHLQGSPVPLSLQETVTFTRTPLAGDNVPNISGYQFERLIGRGGIGRVYLAKRVATGESVAVKLLLPDVAGSKEARRRFLREIESMAALRHDRLVALLDHGEVQRCFYLVMPYYERGNLAQWVRRNGAPNLEPAVGLILDVLEGLAFVHASNYVHRDIKPQNLLVDDNNRVVVADLGLAKSLEETALLDITKTGDAAGTAPFMPREQAINFKRVYPTTDVWAVGAVLYWLLCGVTPRDAHSTSHSFHSVLHRPVVPIRERWPAMPSALADLIDIVLSDDPRRRPANAIAFRLQLEDALGTILAKSATTS